MRPARLLLHALLCITLVVNGMDAAEAAVRAACPSTSVAADARAADPQAEDPHAGHGMADRGEAQGDGLHHHDSGHRADNTAHVTPPLAEAPDGDCPHGDGCGDCAAACRSACLAQHACAVLPMRFAALSPAHDAYSPAPVRAHPAPTLPHPIRPPISQA